MTLHRSMLSRVRRAVITMPVLAGLCIATSQAGALPAPQVDRGRGERTLFTWTGRVDREVLIVVRDREVQTRGFDAALPSRTRVNSALPRTGADVFVVVNDGRGDVDVIEQPSARNGYQAVLRVRDPRAGADSYRLTAYVYDRGDYRGNDRDGRGGGWGWGGRRDGDNDRRDNDRRGGGGSLSWSGRVDDVVEIQLSGRRVDAITRSGNRVSDVNANVSGSGLPNRNVTLRLDLRAGRGDIAVVQQPSAWNGYTAVIRIYDRRSGAAYYDFTAYWD